jgi:hypothetical protein
LTKKCVTLEISYVQPGKLHTKCVVEIFDAKYEKAHLPAIIRENCSHLTASDREKLLSVQLRFESLFDGTVGDGKLLPVSFELKEGMKPYHGRPYPILHKHKAILVKKKSSGCATLECWSGNHHHDGHR